MHSKQKLLNWPSGVSFVSTEELLEYYYVGGESIRSDLGIFDSLDAYNMSRFHNETASTFDIVYCQFGPNDCRELWVPVMTYFGQGVFIRDKSELQTLKIIFEKESFLLKSLYAVLLF